MDTISNLFRALSEQEEEENERTSGLQIRLQGDPEVGRNTTIDLGNDSSEGSEGVEATEEETPLFVPVERNNFRSEEEARSYLKALETEYALKFDRVRSRIAELERCIDAETERLTEARRRTAIAEAEIRALNSERRSAETAFVAWNERHDARVKKARDFLSRRSSRPDPELDALIRDELECPCCYNAMRSEIYQCNAGHLICKECYGRLSSCPVCRVTYAGTPIRNRLAEKLGGRNSRSNVSRVPL